jgi:hypothetical protein
MKTYEIEILKQTSGFSSMKEALTTRVEEFLNQKSKEGYEVVNVSFTYYEAMELIAFVTLCK